MEACDENPDRPDDEQPGDGGEQQYQPRVMSCGPTAPCARRNPRLLDQRDAQLLYRQLGFVTHPFECMVRADTAIATCGVSSRAT